jgi:uncharacterized protein
MTRDETIALLRAHQAAFDRFGVRALIRFGSIARNEATSASDVDVLVDFGGPATFAQYMDLRLYLEDLLGTKVDLVTERDLRPRVRPYVERDAIRVA